MAKENISGIHCILVYLRTNKEHFKLREVCQCSLRLREVSVAVPQSCLYDTRREEEAFDQQWDMI